MCIRDSQGTEGRIPSHVALMFGTKAEIARVSAAGLWQPTDYGYLIRDYLEYNLSNCLLYTSDAADDLLCVDLGGRRIIQKKTQLSSTQRIHRTINHQSN